MNDRDFAAAHDRYLEPPDEQDDTEDEDTPYDIARQRRLDEEDFAARQKEWNDEND